MQAEGPDLLSILMELSRAGRTENKGRQGRAQANAEGPGLNNLAASGNVDREADALPRPAECRGLLF